MHRMFSLVEGGQMLIFDSGWNSAGKFLSPVNLLADFRGLNPISQAFRQYVTDRPEGAS